MPDDFGEERQQRPRKFAEVKVVIWDDGEMEVDCVRFKENALGRGAPRKILFEDNKKWMEEVDAEAASRFGLRKFLMNELDLEDKDVEKSDDSEDFDVDDVDDEIEDE